MASYLVTLAAKLTIDREIKTHYQEPYSTQVKFKWQEPYLAKVKFKWQDVQEQNFDWRLLLNIFFD